MTYRFQFTVSGDKQAGCVYVTARGIGFCAALVKATKIAAKRSGDASPVFHRITLQHKES